MTLLLKHGGVHKVPLAGWTKIAGVWREVAAVDRFDGVSWLREYQNERVVTLVANASNVIAKNLFDANDWAADVTKRLIIAPGVEIDSPSFGSGVALANTPNAEGQAGSFGGRLIIENYGTISGYGGSANGGNGGTAYRTIHPGKDGQPVEFFNYGVLRGGGGGGGQGGQGGPGYCQTPYTYTEGPYYNSTSNPTYFYDDSNSRWWWAGSNIGTNPNTTFSTGGWVYVRGAFRGETYYEISRYQTRYNTYYTTGGAGGAGGRGKGADGAALTGSNGAGGGTNAGAGGRGGDGGGWGEDGAIGATGASGNNGGGSAGASGGNKGAYLNGSADTVFVNAGTVLGRVI